MAYNLLSWHAEGASLRGENPGPGKDVHGELDPTPGMTVFQLRPTFLVDRSQQPGVWARNVRGDPRTTHVRTDGQLP